MRVFDIIKYADRVYFIDLFNDDSMDKREIIYPFSLTSKLASLHLYLKEITLLRNLKFISIRWDHGAPNEIQEKKWKNLLDPHSLAHEFEYFQSKEWLELVASFSTSSQ